RIDAKPRAVGSDQLIYPGATGSPTLFGPTRLLCARHLALNTVNARAREKTQEIAALIPGPVGGLVNFIDFEPSPTDQVNPGCNRRLSGRLRHGEIARRHRLTLRHRGHENRL